MIRTSTEQLEFNNIYQTAINLRDVGIECMKIERYSDAVFLFKKAQLHFEKIFGFSSLESVDLLCKTGICFNYKNETTKANECFDKAYIINQNLLGKNDVDTEQTLQRKRSVSC